MKLLIVGAGLGGLTAALALRRAGFDVEVHEAANELGEVGAGLTLSRGAQAVFRDLGLQDRIAAHACRSMALPFVHYRTGRILAGETDGATGQPDDGTADVARQIHRADLHRILVEGFGEIGPPVQTGHRLVGLEQGVSAVEVRFANGARARGDALVAADGVRSAVRELLLGDDAPRFTGQVAYRFLVPSERARPFLNLGRAAVFVGPRRTFNRYTLRGGAVLNCVGIAATDEWVGEGWSTPATTAEMLDAFAGWHGDVTGLVERAESAIKWGLFDRAPLGRWAHGRVTLLGDAAHAMLPFLGMGAAMAIEDGMILARAFATEREVGPAFARYEAARRPRTALLHAKSVEQGVLTQARDPDAYDHHAAPAADPEILGYDPVAAAI
ncbi:FAD-dependent monooxygenase [Novosphingobium sp. Gsoil 351]|uniref:FAD-dependent monooxygenase n=1 Tax=Novosphingobium sp. Gsoil 351 TaxID=2675225 RepID=UPI0018A80CF8|nr:FAD-dependent monooxygenase [Novosphingobium sp. Gsoil 351]